MIGQTRKMLHAAFGVVVRKASRNYIAGPTLDDAQRVSRYLVNHGYWVTQGYWDSGSDEPRQVCDIYLAAMQQLTELSGKNYFSLKVPALHYNSAMYEALLVASRQLGVPVHFDSLAPEQADQMYAFIREHNTAREDIGCTLPGRWRRSITDAELVNDLGLNVRVVKGQWEDPNDRQRDSRVGYLEVIERLAGKARCVRVATHDAPLARTALSCLKAADTCCELELLYGLPVTNLVSTAAELGVPVRIYIAFGHAFLPYVLSSFGKHPAMILKLLRESYKRNYLSSFPVCTSNYLV